MARAQGARALMALAFETTYGTPPAGGFTKMPFASTTLGAEQPLLNSELLGYGRDPLAPIKDAVTADGDVVVPLDAEAFGFWLKAAFGAPTTTGTGPWTHEFQSGSWTLPSLSIETGMPEVPRYAMYSGCVLDQITWQMQRSGLLTATARLVAQGETVGTTTSAGTPAALELKRFGHFNGSIKLNFRDLVTSLIADLAKLAARRFILGPIANALSGALGGAGGIFANILHAGGIVGSSGPSRMVPAMAFAAAPRMHSGGAVGLRHDEVPAILQRGERVLSRREAQSYGAGGGRRTEVLGHDHTDGIAVLTLLEAPVRAISEGDGFTIRAGCDKRIETCGEKFANTTSFRGFPHIPGQDAVLRYATKDGGHDGGVL